MNGIQINYQIIRYNGDIITNKEYTKGHWKTKAKDNISSSIVTLNDHFQRELEINFIIKYLQSSDKLLEVGCGNGYSTNYFAKYVNEVVAVDYSKEMIERAKSEFGDIENARFIVNDVLNLEFKPNTFDCVVTERCLINLSSWEDQKKAFNNIFNVLKPGGHFIFVEGIEDGIRNLNLIRKNIGLKEIVTAKYNLNFVENELIDYLKTKFEFLVINKFGTYDYISRIVHPKLVWPNEPQYDSNINKIAKEIQDSTYNTDLDKYSRLICIVLKKSTLKN